MIVFIYLLFFLHCTVAISATSLRYKIIRLKNNK